MGLRFQAASLLVIIGMGGCGSPGDGFEDSVAPPSDVAIVDVEITFALASAGKPRRL